MKISVLGGLALALLSTTAAAQLRDPLTETTDPADRAVLAEASAAVAGRPPDIARLDTVLAKLPRPTPLRGMVQTVRAAVLGQARDPGAAIAAIEDALRLLPEDPRPKMVATGLFTFAGSPQRAADLWLRASDESPDIARMTDNYVITALVGRLTEIGDRERADRVNARLGEIGFARGSAPDRSRAALASVRRDVAAGQLARALQTIPAVANPGDLLGLYVDRRYEALWPRIAEWAGPTLEAQSRRYLEELRRDWVAAKDFTSASAYARRLAAARAYPAIVALFLPMIDEGVMRSKEDVEFLGPIVARALMRQRRAGEAAAVLDKVEAAMPAADAGNRLNIAAARMTGALDDGDWDQTIARADAFLARARELGPGVNAEAVMSVTRARACALWKLGRRAQADETAALVLREEARLPAPAYAYHICRGDEASARALLIRRLDDEATRDWALRELQPDGQPPETVLGREALEVRTAVQADPAVRAAAVKVGRILPNPVLEGLPDGFDPLRPDAPRRPLRPGDI